MSPGSVDVVLVRPSRAGNVAAASRAMKNMGLGRLCLVEPPPDLAAPEARALAYGAWDVLDGARVSATLREAVAEATLVVGTSGRPLPSAWTPRQLAEEGPARAGSGRTALVFGPEASGLRNDELALCHVHVHIPSDAAQPSLNLAQAVLVLAYEIRLSSLRLTTPPAGSGGAPERATSADIEATLDDLARAAGHRLLEPGQPRQDPGRAARPAGARRAHAARDLARAGDGAPDPLGRGRRCARAGRGRIMSAPPEA